jgi:hypothetical protein
MKKDCLKLSTIAKEFDEFIKIQNSIKNPKLESIKDLFNIFNPKNELLINQQKLYSLPQDQYFAVVNAVNALDLFGNGEIGMEIYNKNKTAYVISRKVNDLFLF